MLRFRPSFWTTRGRVGLVVPDAKPIVQNEPRSPWTSGWSVKARPGVLRYPVRAVSGPQMFLRSQAWKGAS